MCTLSVIPIANSGIRVAVNRDESPLRPAAAPPRIERFGERQAILPRDALAGGTWVAASDAGLVMTLLNATGGAGVSPLITRGAIIPSLLDAPSLAAVVDRAQRIDFTHYAPFRLVVMDQNEAVELGLDGAQLTVRERLQIDRPRIYTSSGLGDEVVGVPRRALFAEFFDGGDVTSASQDEFHRHRWPGHEGISVSLLRAEARTVSQTFVEIDSAAVTLTYHAAPPDQTAPLVNFSIPLVGVGE